jgi:hypothetical protein
MVSVTSMFATNDIGKQAGFSEYLAARWFIIPTQVSLGKQDVH